MSLQVWLPLNGDLHNQGCSNVTVTNNGATVNTNGKIGSCYHFGTASQYMNISKEAMNTFTTECSITFWLKIKSWNTSYATFFQAGLGGTAWTHYIFGFLRNNANSTVCFTISNGSSASNASYLTSSLSLDTWYHVVLTYTTGKCTIYLNGALDHEYTTSIVPNFAGITTITLGKCNNGSSYQTDCDINDFRIYDHCLSVTEIREISQGLVLHYKLDSIGPSFGNPNLLLEGMTPTAAGNGATGVVRSIENGVQKVVADNPNSNWCTFGNHNTTLALTKGDTFTFSLMIRSPDSTKKPTVYFQSGLGYYSMQGTMSTDWTIIYYTGTWSIDNLQTNIHLGFSSAPGTYYIKYFKLEKGNTVTLWAPKEGEPLSNLKYIEDSSGYNHNGTIVGNLTLTNNTPRYSAATVFNGSSKIYNTTAPIRNTNGTPLTVSCWFYQTSRSGYRDLVTARSSSAYTWMLYTHTTDGSIQLHGSAQNKSTVIPDLNTWHHVTAVVNDDSTYNLYLDGTKVISAADYSYQSQNADTINIGAYGSTTTIKEGWIGYMSDVRIYCTALDDDAIHQLYEVGAKVDNKQNLHAFELVENNSKIQITKRGQVKCNELEEDEKTKFYQADQIIETNEIIEL